MPVALNCAIFRCVGKRRAKKLGHEQLFFVATAFSTSSLSKKRSLKTGLNKGMIKTPHPADPEERGADSMPDFRSGG